MDITNIKNIAKIKKTPTGEMLKFLEARDKYQYMFMSNDIKNIGAPYIDLLGVENYIFERSGDFIIVRRMIADGYIYYAELSEDAHIVKLIEMINAHKNSGAMKGYKITSNGESIFLNDIFIESFGRLEYKKIEMFGIKNIKNIKNTGNTGDSPGFNPEDISIRRLTGADEKIAAAFEEIRAEFRIDLRTGFRHYIQEKEETGIIYGAFENGVLCGYVCVYTFDEKTWDIDYIYVNENHRGKGIARKLANYYANDLMRNGVTVCYGNADNEASKRVALSSGFDLCSVSYGCDWIHVKD